MKSVSMVKPLLSMEGICKSFPGVDAVVNGHLDLYPGEVHALIGENGAGKSTFIKIAAGVHRADTGTIKIDGKVIDIHHPIDSLNAGISVIYQEFNLVPSLSVRENILLGREKSRFGFFSKSLEKKEIKKIFAELDVDIDPEARCDTLTIAQQQIVEIAKALSINARIIIMDEPTSALTPQEVQSLFNLILKLKHQSISIIYITHRLSELFAIADRITIMRDGKRIGTYPTAELSRDRLVELMVGRALDKEFPKAKTKPDEIYLEVRNLNSSDKVKNVSFNLRRGEILGITGLMGSGRTETARLIFGADRADSGRILLHGKKVKIESPKDAIQQGICLLTEDRKAQGLVLSLSARENFALGNLKRWSKSGFIKEKKERNRFQKYISNLKIKLTDQDQKSMNLSGGNQQKILIAKWLESNSDIIIFDEPTRGIDVGAKYEIYLLINELIKNGKSVIMISSEFPEVLGMSDRILVMCEGEISGEIRDVRRATTKDIMRLAVKEKEKTLQNQAK